MVFVLRRELGTSQGTVARVAAQLDIGVESLRSWVRQAEIDGGERPGTSSVEAGEPQGVASGGEGAAPGELDPQVGVGFLRRSHRPSK